MCDACKLLISEERQKEVMEKKEKLFCFHHYEQYKLNKTPKTPCKKAVTSRPA